MARIFITGSSDGLGSRAAKALVQRGHQVTLHARNAQRAKDAEAACPGAAGTMIADLSSTEEVKKLAESLNKSGTFDAIIHNAGVMHGVSGKTGKEGMPMLFAVNTLAPYSLTCLVNKPKNLVFLSSQLHNSGDPSLRDIQQCGYSDSKLHNTLLAFAFARYWPDVTVSSLDPGWVQTKMGGAGASDDIDAAVDTYVMLAEGGQKVDGKSGQHWYQCSSSRKTKSEARSQEKQDELVAQLEKISGISIPIKSAQL